MKYVIYSKRTWFWLVWSQVWAIFDFLVLWYDPNARTNWWFIIAVVVQPVSALSYLIFWRLRRQVVTPPVTSA